MADQINNSSANLVSPGTLRNYSPKHEASLPKPPQAVPDSVSPLASETTGIHSLTRPHPPTSGPPSAPASLQQPTSKKPPPKVQFLPQTMCLTARGRLSRRWLWARGGGMRLRFPCGSRSLSSRGRRRNGLCFCGESWGSMHWACSRPCHQLLRQIIGGEMR